MKHVVPEFVSKNSEYEELDECGDRKIETLHLNKSQI